MRIKVPSVDDIHGISKFYESRVYSCVDDGHVVSSVGVNHSPSLAVSGCSLSLCLRPSVCLWFLFPTPSGWVCSVSITVHNIQIKLKSQDVQVIYDTLRWHYTRIITVVLRYYVVYWRQTILKSCDIERTRVALSGHMTLMRCDIVRRHDTHSNYH